MAVDYKLVFRQHVIQRMFERGVNRDDIRAVLEYGEVIRDYPDYKPYPSRLILGWRAERPLHVVAADNDVGRETIIITVYEPDVEIWENDFKRKK